jgi:WD40 repeat protein
VSPPVVLPLNDSVLSTIAIAISPNGETIATSHGDHTIKVFFYHTGKQYRIFRGHPRTPWTVKYHSTDSNIVARLTKSFSRITYSHLYNLFYATTSLTTSFLFSFVPTSQWLFGLRSSCMEP